MASDSLLEQAKKMKENQQRELSAIRANGKAKGGAVAAKMDGHKHLLSIRIDPELLGADDLGELEQQVIDAVNQATKKMEAILFRKFGESSGIPDLF